MNVLLNFIKNISAVHKFAIVVIALCCLAFATSKVGEQHDQQATLLKLEYQQCAQDNLTDTAARKKCQSERLEENQKFSDHGIIYLGAIASGLALFPLYLILYNIFYILKFGYKNRYDHSKMNKMERFIHFSGMSYLSIIVIGLILYHEVSLVDKKIGSHLPSKTFFYDGFGDKQAAFLGVDGIWINNAIPIKELNFKYIDYDNYVTKIECWKEKGKCDHAISHNTIGEDYHLIYVDYEESQIEYWGQDKIVSVENDLCVRTKYTFDLKAELVTREEMQNEDRHYGCGRFEKKSFTLSDGVDVEMAIENNEAGPVTNAIRYILGGIFK